MPGTDYVGQIDSVSTKWKLSLAVSSNEVKNLNEPMVNMILSTKDESETECKRSIEMTVSQFKEFKSILEQIKLQMDNAKLM